MPKKEYKSRTIAEPIMKHFVRAQIHYRDEGAQDLSQSDVPRKETKRSGMFTTNTLSQKSRR